MMTKQITLHANRTDAGEHVNITAQVNSAQIRREQVNGRDTWIVPSMSLPANVIMNGGLYPSAEIDAHYPELDGTVAPLGHPTVNGEFVSAFSPAGLAGFYVGATNQNVKKVGNRVYIEKFIDVQNAEGSEGGKRLLSRLEALEKGEDVPPIHTSVAAFLERLEANEQQQAQGAQWVAKIHRFDHDAILLDEVGAATPEQGVGMMVNADQAQPIAANEGVLVGESMRQREQRRHDAAKARFVTSDDDYVWIADFTGSQAVIVRSGGPAEVYGYTDEGGKITFSDTGTPVVRQESWVATVTNSLKRFFTQQVRPANNLEGNHMPITPEERADLTKDISEAVTANVATALADAIKPITEKVEAMEANITATNEAVTANARKDEADKREAVKAKLGEVVANALSGEALDEAYKQIGTTAPLGDGQSIQPNTDEGAPDPAAYFVGAK